LKRFAVGLTGETSPANPPGRMVADRYAAAHAVIKKIMEYRQAT